MLLNSATQGLTDAQVYQDLVRAGTHIDLDGVANGHVQGVPSIVTNNPCLVMTYPKVRIQLCSRYSAITSESPKVMSVHL